MSLIFYLRFRRFRKNGRFVADINFPPDQFPPLATLYNTLCDFSILRMTKDISRSYEYRRKEKNNSPNSDALRSITSEKKILELETISKNIRYHFTPNSDLSYFV